MTAEQLSSIVGVVLSLACAYVPGISEWFNGLSGKQKTTLMGVLLILVSLVIFGLSCGAITETGIKCDKAGAEQLFWILIAALMANQTVYGAERAVKAFRK